KTDIPDNSARQDAVSWFPKDVTLVASMDFRNAYDPESTKSMKKFLDQIFTIAPPNARDQVYTAVEEIGNVRLDRLAVAIADDPNPDKMKIYIRVSGKGNHQRIVATFQKGPGPGGFGQAPKVNEEKGFRGRKVTTIDLGHMPVIALIGNEDLILAGYGNTNQ